MISKHIRWDHLNIYLIENLANVPFSLTEVDHSVGIKTSVMSTSHSTDTSGVQMCLRVALLAHCTMLMTGFALSPELTLD